MIENWESCNLLGIFRRIGFKARLVNCREAAYLNVSLHLTQGPVALGSGELVVGKKDEMKETALLIFSLLAGGSGYLIVTFWMDPVLRYLNIRHEVTSDLLFYSNVTYEDLLGFELKQRAKDRRIANRKHASEIAACYYRLPWWYKKFFLNRRNEDPLRASRSLIGLSNSSNITYDKHIAALKIALNLKDLDV